MSAREHVTEDMLHNHVNRLSFGLRRRRYTGDFKFGSVSGYLGLLGDGDTCWLAGYAKRYRGLARGMSRIDRMPDRGFLVNQTCAFAFVGLAINTALRYG